MLHEDLHFVISLVQPLTAAGHASDQSFCMQAIAEQYMPKLEVASGMELDVEDVHGKQYTLKFRWVPRPSAAIRHVISLMLWEVRSDGRVHLLYCATFSSWMLALFDAHCVRRFAWKRI